MPIAEDKRKEIQNVFRTFLQNQARLIQRLRIEDLHINPFLIRILSKEMGLKDASSIVRWLVSQRLERSVVTSFGLALQEAARVFSEGTGVEGADILKTKDGRHHYIQVKSGPNTIPKDLGVRISQLLRSAQRRNRGSVALFGMCYGSKKQVSSIVRKYVGEEGKIDWLAGREFWEFISDTPGCIEEIFEIASQVGEDFQGPDGRTLSQILEAKVADLCTEFQKMYGESGEEMWKRLLDQNS
jgi:hypothetical protein